MSIQRFGVSIDPSVLVVEYQDQQSGKIFTKRIHLDKHLNAEVRTIKVMIMMTMAIAFLYYNDHTR